MIRPSSDSSSVMDHCLRDPSATIHGDDSVESDADPQFPFIDIFLRTFRTTHKHAHPASCSHIIDRCRQS